MDTNIAAEARVLDLLARFPGARLAGGTERDIAERLVRAEALSTNLGGDDQVLVMLVRAYPEVVIAAGPAGLDEPDQLEAKLWLRHEVELRQRATSEPTPAQLAAQAKRERRANRRR